MQNFDYRTPTRLIFGRDVIHQLPDVLRPLGTKILLTYGGGSIKKTGLYDQILSLLSGFEVAELSGIAPNPRYDPSVLDGVRICKERGIQAILAVGGGSVLDCSKAIAAGALHDGAPWDLITGKFPVRAALPVVSVMTMAATGSEYDAAAVISRSDTNDKVCLIAPPLFPVASFVDPTYTVTVPRRRSTIDCRPSAVPALSRSTPVPRPVPCLSLPSCFSPLRFRMDMIGFCQRC
ncbi:MAG: iron-containing alcohol dehydrogenase [Kiritimatiellae bacterium]|nr:iron-containing alcohol dehydrogenase [Kiritimatiellia bacterium]